MNHRSHGCWVALAACAVAASVASACSSDDSATGNPGGQAGSGGTGGADGGAGGSHAGTGGSVGGSGGSVGGSGGSVGGSGGSVGGSGGSVGGSGGSVGGSGGGSTDLYGDVHQGQYHLGPVDFAETQWHNACAPAGGYRQELRTATGLGGEYLAGVSNTYSGDGEVCDSCIFISTGAGKSIIARVVTYGATNDPGDIDVSPSVYDALDTGEYPRAMTWQFAKCPDTGTLVYEFQSGSSIWWTSFWVRNQRVPLTKVEVKSANHSAFFELRREADGTVNDDGGFGDGPFTLRLTGMDGQTIDDSFNAFTPGALLSSTKQFP